MSNNINANSPAFPCVPIQDNYNRLIAPIPGMNKLEYFALKIYCTNKNLMQEEADMEAAINEAMRLLNKLEKYQSIQNEQKTETPIISIS